MEEQIRDHRLHPSCPLALDRSGKQFVCSACKLAGSRMLTYCCSKGCDFNLHGQCATCPEKFSFWGHPQHDIVLEHSRADMGRTLLEVRADVHAALVSSTPHGGVLPVCCEMCTNEIEGMHYFCRSCGFFVHTVCAMLPKLMPSVAHEHELALFCSAPTMCTACQTPAVWAYRCMPCLAFYHQNCLPENAEMFAKPFKNLPPNPFVVPPQMVPPTINEANPFGLAHTYRHRGL
ncbi:uncharacterized protein LOC120713706 [Panicum virgatum]|uniref:DC1 domain-containing protein n=1 Tax=Panicum virgatum TaxID=38727 RepID=A0A8T0RJ03_PANVG|nr:uncharacterized protein LOC120713706 [Panicum virgatum]KAG2584783.1 hypothetical protein PVAP13_6KG347706 [Panicum virgatum]